ncbi:MAG TPA: 5-methyltetrahydropteroyltriglutamate--homocysteine S-methyltransferase [Candidatus Acidoferrales bacterium]|nr:5-methyltetrahydropteroyltriglutamate--homocysteine S-methyltransferase [Candidatus Acidoferrales bacterium]
MTRNTPPFRADHVGSLLRPAPLKEARNRRERGEISAAELATAEDAAIEWIIARQAAVGLLSATDGEFRRAMWHFDFLEHLDGVQSFRSDHGIAFQGGIETQAKGLRVTGKLGFSGHPMLEHFRFLRDRTSATPKMTIPSPSVLHFRGGRRGVDPGVYPEMEEFYRDLAGAYRRAVQAFAACGCRYLQLDEVNLAYLCDPEQRQMLRNRGDDPDRLPGVYAGMINTAISGRPTNMAITMHLCRGNFRSSWIAQGGYEPVAELLFNEIGVDGYFMEFDTERAGGFEPLRFVPKGKVVVLGIMTSKSGALESVEHLERRIEEAARFVDPDQLCLSPQCGFASTEEGNSLSEDEQWAKLERVVEVAGRVWPG